MPAPSCVARTRQGAAKLTLAATSVAPGASGYARALRRCERGFSRLASAIATGGDR